MKKVKIGVMGAYRGTSMISYCNAANNAEVVAICDKFLPALDKQRELLGDHIAYYDTFDEPVRFPFGFGLSYAEFAYSDLAIDKKSETDYDVSFTVTNTSDVDAKEIAQLYVRDPIAMVSRPQKELKGFRKIALKAGESRRVTLSLDARSFAYYSVPLKKWHVENGAFEIMIGASSRDIRLSATVKIALPETEQLTRV